jgi:hypothetical protein
MIQHVAFQQPRHVPVIKISLPYVYKAAEQLEPLASIQAGTRISENLFVLLSANMMINEILNNSVFASTLRSCRQTGERLMITISNLIQITNSEEVLQQHQPIILRQQMSEFKTALLAEIGVLPSYFVNQKGGFDTLTLLEWGQLLFPSDLNDKVPDAVFDIQQAAKALAFELPTSSGFHTFRATESVLRRYYTQVTGGQPLPKVRNIGIYIRALRMANCGDEIILASLEQLTKLHRNPLIHPEAVLTMDEAISTLGMARSAVTAMLRVLPTLAPTTVSP